jgi:hypothetical protein
MSACVPTKQKMWQSHHRMCEELHGLKSLKGYHKSQMVAVMSAKKITQLTSGNFDTLKRPCLNWHESA